MIGLTRGAAQEISAEHQLRTRMAALGRLAEPALRQMMIWGDIVSAMIKRAKREHRARVPLASCLLEQCKGLLMGGLTATAVDEHLAKQNLGVHQARVGGRAPGGSRARGTP